MTWNDVRAGLSFEFPALAVAAALAAFGATGATLAIHLSIHALDRVVADLLPHIDEESVKLDLGPAGHALSIGGAYFDEDTGMELDALAGIFGTQDALLGLRSVGSRETPPWQGM